jgi:4-amino-4-deoxy-L-arabinose transferase-like glycosyltransferase
MLNKININPAKQKPDQPQVIAVMPLGWQWREQHLIALGFVLFFSAVVGLLGVIQFQDSPFFNLPILDEKSYVDWAKRIAGGDVLGKTIFYQDPLYPYFLGLIFALFGENYFLVRILQVVMGLGSVALVYWTGRKLLGPWPGVMAAATLALYHGLYFFELQILKSSLVLLVSAASCALGVSAADKPRSWWRWGALGLSLGLLMLLRGNFQPILPLLIVWSLFVVRAEPPRQKILRVGLMVAGIVLVLAPVTIRNHAVGGEWVLTTSQGGANFYIGNNERANGRYVILPFVRPDPTWEAKDFQAEAEKRVGHKLKPTEVSNFWFSESFKWIQADPARAFRLTLHKARLLIHQYEIPDNHSFYLTRQKFVPVLWLAVLGFGVLWGPALIGALWLPLRDRRALYPALFTLLYGLSIIPFYIVDRYRLALCPAFALFFAAGIFFMARKWRARQRVAVAIAGIWLLASLLLGFLPTPESRSPMMMEYYLLGNAYLITGKPESAIACYDLALKVQPDNKEAVNNRMIAIRQLSGGDIKRQEDVKAFSKTGQD